MRTNSDLRAAGRSDLSGRWLEAAIIKKTIEDDKSKIVENSI